MNRKTNELDSAEVAPLWSMMPRDPHRQCRWSRIGLPVAPPSSAATPQRSAVLGRLRHSGPRLLRIDVQIHPAMIRRPRAAILGRHPVSWVLPVWIAVVALGPQAFSLALVLVCLLRDGLIGSGSTRDPKSLGNSWAPQLAEELGADQSQAASDRCCPANHVGSRGLAANNAREGESQSTRRRIRPQSFTGVL
jgi:hypothetical protein